MALSIIALAAQYSLELSSIYDSGQKKLKDGKTVDFITTNSGFTFYG